MEFLTNPETVHNTWILHFRLLSRIALGFVAICIFLGILWVVYLSIRTVLSLCRKAKAQVVGGEVSIVKKSKIILESTQNCLLLCACTAIIISLTTFAVSCYEVGVGLRSIIHNSYQINCEPSKHRYVGILSSKMIYNGYSLVFASCSIRLIHILINLYLKIYNSKFLKNKVTSDIAVMILLMCVAIVGVSITCSTFYTCVAVWFCICVQAFLLCYKVYKFNLLLLKHQEDAIDLYQNLNLRNELRQIRFRFFFLAIPICGVSIMAIALYACTIALSSFYSTLAECSYLYTIFHIQVKEYLPALHQFVIIIILEYMVFILATTIALVILTPVGLYTGYFISKSIFRSHTHRKESDVSESITQTLLEDHQLP